MFEVIDVESPTDEQESNFYKSFDEIEAQIFKSLNLSIISGDYCQYENFSGQLSEIQSVINTTNGQLIIGFEDAQHPDSLESYVYHLTKNFFEPIKIALDYFIQFTSQVDGKLRLHRDRVYLQMSYESLLTSLNYDNKSQKNLNFFRQNIFVAKCDHFITAEGAVDIADLEEVIINLEDNFFNPFAKTLSNKALYIRNKLLFRMYIKRQGETESNNVFIINKGVEKRFSVKDYSIAPYLDDWLDYLVTHYEINDSWRTTLTDQHENLEKALDECSLRELHLKIKFNKDVKKSSKGLTNIRDEIERRYSSSKSESLPNKLDIYAYKLSLSYCINNEFSLLCEDPVKNADKISSFYTILKEKQEEFSINNFFPQTKYLGYQLTLLQEYFKNNSVLEHIDECSKIIDVCNEIEKEYKKNINWIFNNYNYVFQLPFEECTVDVSSSGAVDKLFIFSSCFLPLDRDKLQRDFDEFHDEIVNYQSSIRILKNTKKETQKLLTLKTDLEKIKKDSDRREIKTLEVLAVFTAIVTFVASSIPGFKFIETGSQAIYFTLALGTSLSWFALLLFSMNRGYETIKKLKWWIITSILIAIVAWIALFFSTPKVIPSTLHNTTTISKPSSQDKVNLDLNIQNECCKPQADSCYIANKKSTPKK